MPRSHPFNVSHFIGSATATTHTLNITTPPGLAGAPGPSLVYVHKVMFCWPEASVGMIAVKAVIEAINTPTIGPITLFSNMNASVQGGMAFWDFGAAPLEAPGYRGKITEPPQPGSGSRIVCSQLDASQTALTSVGSGTIWPSITVIWSLG